MRNLRDYTVITASYWVFTLTDGALRMLVLFYLHQLGYSPLQVASLFLFYEFSGVVTNLIGGWLGARFGLKSTLFTGLSLQIAACSLLGFTATNLTIPIVMLAQAVSGIAKDLTKMSSKSYIKLVVPEGDAAGLMKWVAILTGSKNALKGIGFFLGASLLGTLGFGPANLAMAATLTVVLLVSITMLPRGAGRSKSKLGLRHLLSKDPRINCLAMARMFLFGSRDVWFVLALPIYLSTELGWSTAQSGAFLAIWIIGYGIVQASSPALFRGQDRLPESSHVLWWTSVLLAPLAAIATLIHLGIAPTTSLITGLTVFGIAFAINSAVHSFLIVHYADGDKVSLDVGFYYTANAMGRLFGTILSGAVFQWAGMRTAGLIACILVSMVLVALSALSCVPLRKHSRKLHSSAR